MRSEDISIYPKKEQPKRGYLHPRHLKGRGSDGKDYCIAPSASIYDRKYLNV